MGAGGSGARELEIQRKEVQIGGADYLGKRRVFAVRELENFI